MIFGMDADQALRFAHDKLSSGDTADAAQGFKVLCAIYSETKSQDVLEDIVRLYKVAQNEKDLPLRQDTILKIALAKNMTEEFDSFQGSLTDEDSLSVRSCLTGKTIEQLQEEDREASRIAEAKRKQALEWSSQGLCQNCGGQLGIFKKCKSCGRKN